MRKVQRNGYRAALMVGIFGLLSAIILCATSYMLKCEIGMLVGIGFVILHSILIGVNGTMAKAYNVLYKAEMEIPDSIGEMEEKMEHTENRPFKELNNECK